MTSDPYQVQRPTVTVSMYWPEATCILLCWLTPIISWWIWPDPYKLARSGSLMVFFAVLAEFITLGRMNKKHILNACRAAAHERPWDFSGAARVVGIAALVSALAGTVLWGYGDL